MRTYETTPRAIKHLVAYRLGEGVYRLIDHNLAVIDPNEGKALVIDMNIPTSGKLKVSSYYREKPIKINTGSNSQLTQ